jgi:hypothetical protein
MQTPGDMPPSLSPAADSILHASLPPLPFSRPLQICCTVRGDLIRILNKLIKRKDKFDAILIETTGLADPSPVIQTFFVDEDIKDACLLDAVLTVVDTKHVMMHLDEVKPDGIVNEAGTLTCLHAC